MTEGQYRSLIAYMNFWTPQYSWMNLDTAIRDIGITDDREEVIGHLWSCLWQFDEATGLLTYNDTQTEEDEGDDEVPGHSPAGTV